MSIYFRKNFQRAFGTYPLQGDELLHALNAAVQIGYRAIDTAQMYANESEVGAFLADSEIPTEDFCVTTKVMPSNFGEKDFLNSVEESLKKLRLNQVTVLLLHWPPADGNIEPSLKLLQKAYDRKLAANIGISNYNSKMMKLAKEIIDAPIATNQVEFHPLLNQEKLLRASAETGIPLSSYCSVARGKIFEQETLKNLARDYEKSVAQIALQWILQKGVSINTMSTKPANIQKNYEVADFTLSTPDMAKIDRLTAAGYRIVDESLVPWAPEWD